MFLNSNQSFSFNNNQSHKTQIAGNIGANNTQIINTNQYKDKNKLTISDVVMLFEKIQRICNESNLYDYQKEKITRYLEISKEEVKNKKPDKNYIIKNLQKTTEVFKHTGKTVEATKELWKKIEPIIIRLYSWLGVTSSFLLK